MATHEAGGPVHTELYDLLGVAPDATHAEIKKAYYKCSLRWHPDKNPGDAEAEEMFKRVSLAYQVLSDPERRRRYDLGGESSEETEINPTELFSQIFGGGKFESFVGDLGSVLVDMENMAPAEREEVRKDRISKLVHALVVRLQPFVDGRAAEFETTLRAEIKELEQESYGREIIYSLGYIYEQKAKQALGSSEHGASSLWGFKRFIHNTHETFHIIHEAFGSFKAMAEMQRTAESFEKTMQLNPNMDAAERARMEEDLARRGLALFWRLNKLDIEATVREVCEIVLTDSAVPPAVRHQRANGMRLMGKVMRETKPDPSGLPPNVAAQMNFVPPAAAADGPPLPPRS